MGPGWLCNNYELLSIDYTNIIILIKTFISNAEIAPHDHRIDNYGSHNMLCSHYNMLAYKKRQPIIEEGVRRRERSEVQQTVQNKLRNFRTHFSFGLTAFTSAGAHLSKFMVYWQDITKVSMQVLFHQTYFSSTESSFQPNFIRFLSAGTPLCNMAPTISGNTTLASIYVVALVAFCQILPQD